LNGNSGYGSDDYAKEMSLWTIGTKTAFDLIDISILSMFFKNDTPHFFYAVRSI
jgi:hypothetical protein